MRIYSKAVYEWTDEGTLKLNLSESVYRDYSGPLAECKGSASSAEQANADQQRAMENQLAQQQLQLMKGQIGMVDPTIASIIANQGMLPAEQANLTSLVQNQLGQTYGQGIGQLNNYLTQRGMTGGSNAGAGGVAGNYGAMIAALGGQQQAGLANIQNLKSQGLYNAMGTALGIGQMYGGQAQGFNTGASAALGSGVTAAGNADQASQSFLGPLLGSIGSLGGSAITKWCWCAAACYQDGFKNPKVQFIRSRLHFRAMRERKFAVLVAVYSLCGRGVALLIRRSDWLKARFTKLFDSFVLNEQSELLNQAVQEFEL